MKTVTTTQIKKLYGLKKIGSTAKILQHLRYIRRTKEGTQTWQLLQNKLPETYQDAWSEYKDKFYLTTVGTALENARSEIECLQEEMDSWRGNMEGTGLESTYKYEMVDERAEQLYTALDALDDVELSDELGSKQLYDVPTIDTKLKSVRSFGRDRRLGNCLSSLRNILDVLEDDCDEYDAIENVISELEYIEFPGMFG